MVAYLAGSILIDSIVINYEIRAVTHFEHSMAICRPYLETGEEAKILSEFAQIKTRDDYVRLLQRLDGIAHRHGVALRAFSAW
jgi:hypothetical protein